MRVEHLVNLQMSLELDRLICAMLDSVDYLCVTGGTALVVLCVNAKGDASMRLRWTALAYERHGPGGALCERLG